MLHYISSKALGCLYASPAMPWRWVRHLVPWQLASWQSGIVKDEKLDQRELRGQRHTCGSHVMPRWSGSFPMSTSSRSATCGPTATKSRTCVWPQAPEMQSQA